MLNHLCFVNLLILLLYKYNIITKWIYKNIVSLNQLYIIADKCNVYVINICMLDIIDNR